MNRVLIPVTIFLSAFLLFQVQPIMGRFILPWFGGTPAVWSVCLLFFQAALLAGYAYAHWPHRARIHVVLLTASLALLPVIPARPAMTDNPSLRILLLLAVTVGGPYFLLSATAPLLQRWFTQNAEERSPWRLYALSNFGSFLALLSYPFLIEPYVRLRTQAWVWSGFYVAFVILCGVGSVGLQARDFDQRVRRVQRRCRTDPLDHSLLAGPRRRRIDHTPGDHQHRHPRRRRQPVPMDRSFVALPVDVCTRL